MLSYINTYEDIIPIGRINHDGRIVNGYWDPTGTDNQRILSTMQLRHSQLFSSPHIGLIGGALDEQDHILDTIENSIEENTHRPISVVIRPGDPILGVLDDVMIEIDGRINLMDMRHVNDWGLTNEGPSCYLIIHQYDQLLEASNDQRSVVSRLIDILRLARAAHVFMVISTHDQSTLEGEATDNLGTMITKNNEQSSWRIESYGQYDDYQPYDDSDKIS
jgi:hypothetical protein